MTNESGASAALLIGGLTVGVIFGCAAGFVGGMLVFGSRTLQAMTESAESYTEYFDVKVLDYEVRNGKVYVKFANTGNRPVDDMYFEVEVRDENGRLIDEHEVNLMDYVPPGAEEESFLKIYDDEGNAAEVAGDIEVKFQYGWSTNTAKP